VVTDRSGRTLRAGSVYTGGTPYNQENTPGLKSDDGSTWTGGVAFRVNADGSGLEVLGHNFRNSYEVFVDAFGNLWQNDNDDQVATCRTSWLMEGANAGFFSSTGARSWQADRRPGQSIETAHWHQQDPGVMPAGDIYGSGSPTAIVMNESDALGPQYRGLLLSADAGRNIIFGYKPKLVGAGYPLQERTNFISSVETDNKDYRWYQIEEDKSKWFRPSDVAIGTDGAIYVADWYDPVVGGHQMNDKKGYGRIYRITPKNKKLSAPVLDLGSTQGQIQALLSPAINVRNQGFVQLKARGEEALPQVKEVLSSENPYHRARAVWLLSQLGPSGIGQVEALLQDPDPQIRITALRALRQARPEKVTAYARQLVQDPSPAVRREVALALKKIPLAQSKALLLTLAEQYDGQDAWYLNALGLALEGRQQAFYPALLAHFGSPDPERWPQPLANLVWELHPPAAVKALYQRAASRQLPAGEREKALVALAFVPTRAAAMAVRQLARQQQPAELAAQVQYWLQFRKTNDWQAYLQDWQMPGSQLPEAQPHMPALVKKVADPKADMSQRLAAAATLAQSRAGTLHLVQLAAGRALPDTVIGHVRDRLLQGGDRFIKPLVAQYFEPADTLSYPVKAIAGLSADALKGKKLLYSNCLVCHKVGPSGGEIGPVLTHIEQKYDKAGLVQAIAQPDAGIAFGAEPYLITMKNGGIVYGLLLSEGPVVTVLDIYGRRYMMEASQVAGKKQLKGSPMPAPRHLQLSRQDVADITAFLLKPDKAIADQ
jgi:putative heme-binding domain-containing protein